MAIPFFLWKRELQRRFPALASRDFLIFWIGQFISLIGTWMQNTTQPYLAYRLSGSSLDLGILGFAATLPTLFLALPGGVLVERFDKRKTVIAMQTIMMLQAFSLAFLALSGQIRIWHMIFLSFVLGSSSAIEITARQSMLVELVGKEALPNAIALQSTIFNLARVLGPSLSGTILILIRNRGEGWAFLINGLSFLFVIIGLMFIRQPYRVNADLNQKESAITQFKKGQQYVFSNAVILVTLTLALLVGFFGFPFGQQIPAVARTLLVQDGDTETLIKARTSALYLAQGIGALIASLFLSTFSNLRRKGVLMTIGEAAFSIALIFLAATRNLTLALFWLAVLGWAMVTQMAMMNTTVQLESPDALRGRVFSFYLWAIQGIAPFGSLFVGWLAQNQGVASAALVCGVLCLLAVSLVHISRPVLLKRLF